MKQNKKSWPRLTAACLGAMAFVALPAQAVVVTDLFTVDQSLTTPNASSTVSDLSGTSIFGGDRELVVGKNGGNHQIGATVGSGNLNVSPLGGNDVDQGFARVIWDGVGGSAGVVDFDGLAYDITQGGANDRWLMTYLSNGSSFFTTSVTLYTDASNWKSYSISGPNFPNSGTFNGIGTTFNTLSGTTQSGTVDFTQIRAITLQLNEPRTADEFFNIDVLGLYFLNNNDTGNNAGGFTASTLFTPSGGNGGSGGGGTAPGATVPEPGTAGLFVLGLLGLAGALRRRQA